MSTNGRRGDVSPHALEPGTRVGRWRVVEPLGVGGQGAVYLVEDLDHPGELYALKLALHAHDRRAERRAVTGRYPFTEWLSTDVLQYAVVHRRPLSPVEINPQVPRALDEVIMRLLSKTPEARYPSGAAVHEALLAACETPQRWDAPVYEEGSLSPPRRFELPPLAVSTAAPVPAANHGAWRDGLLLAGMMMLTCGALTLVRHAPGLFGGGPTAGADARGAAAVAAGPTPWKNQKRAPCTPKLEVEYSGVCWFPHQQRPPDCPPPTVSYDGRCLLPVPEPRPALPTSLEPVPPGP